MNNKSNNTSNSSNTSNSNKINKFKLEVEKEKTKQLELIRDIKKLELKLRLNKNYQRKQNKSFDMYKMISELNDDNNCSDDKSNNSSNDNDTDDSDNHNDNDDNDDNDDDDNDNDDENENENENDNDNDNDDDIKDTISMCSEYSYQTYEEIDLFEFSKLNKHNI